MRFLVFTLSFLLAFLLFSMQPMVTKMVLPALGGTPGVWNTAMFTFQIVLLAGYYYAHLITTRLSPRRQWLLHGALIAAACFLLPPVIALPAGDALIHQPIRQLMAALLLQVGLPFFVLSATAPLLQSWVARSQHPLSRTPYVLYSASNLGSMAGLIGYIALIEPGLSLHAQSRGWSLLFALGAAALLAAGQRLRPEAPAPRAETPKPPRRQVLLWIWLAFLPSALSLGVTSYITTDIAAVPFLWVLPLALYLLSFVDAFRTRPLLVPLATRSGPLAGLAALLAYGLHIQTTGIFVVQLFVFALLAFALHGWLARLRPEPQQLTHFYFCLSIGGALGGLLNALVAPLVFTTTLEYPLSLMAASITGFFLLGKACKPVAQGRAFIRVFGLVTIHTAIFYLLLGSATGAVTSETWKLDARLLAMAGGMAAFVPILVVRRYAEIFYALLVLVLLLFGMQSGAGQNVRFQQRNFFGVEKIYDDSALGLRYMMHNTTVHGVGAVDAAQPVRVTSYYHALESVAARLPLMRTAPVAAIGLGTGTVQCLAQPDQRFDYFEINPLVVRLATDPAMFRYLHECPGRHRILLGDGRITLAAQTAGKYGVILVDAFSSDAIPTHLMTREAFALYVAKLRPHGVVLLHTTNRHIDLWPLVAGQARSAQLIAYGKHFAAPSDDPALYQSSWVAVARHREDLAPLLAQDEGWNELEPLPGTRPWTDDYTNIVPYLKMLHPDRTAR